MNAVKSKSTVSCVTALAQLKAMTSEVQIGRRELEADCLVAAATRPDIWVKLLAAWVVWHVAKRRRCVVLLERGRGATGLAETLQARFPDLRILLWTGPEAPPGRAPSTTMW